MGTIQKLDHPSFLKLIETFGISEDNEITGSPVIVTDFVEGKRLREHISDQISSKTHFKNESLKLMLKMAQAV